MLEIRHILSFWMNTRIVLFLSVVQRFCIIEAALPQVIAFNITTQSLDKFKTTAKYDVQVSRDAMSQWKFAGPIDGIQIAIEFIPSDWGFESMPRRPKRARHLWLYCDPRWICDHKEKYLQAKWESPWANRGFFENNGLEGPGFSKPRLPRQRCTEAWRARSWGI